MNNTYYLKCSLDNNSIVEYASIPNNPSLLEAKLNEYGKLVIEKRALQTIKKYFVK